MRQFEQRTSRLQWFLCAPWDLVLWTLLLLASIPALLLFVSLRRPLSLLGFTVVAAACFIGTAWFAWPLLGEGVDPGARELLRDRSAFAGLLAATIVAIAYQKRSSDLAFARDVQRDWYDTRDKVMEAVNHLHRVGLVRDQIRAAGDDATATRWSDQLPAASEACRVAFSGATSRVFTLEARARSRSRSFSPPLWDLHDLLLEGMQAGYDDRTGGKDGEMFSFRVLRRLHRLNVAFDRTVSR